MGRVLWGLIVAAVLLATPGVRQWLEPYAQPLLDPVYEWSTRSRVEEISRLLQARTAGGHVLPTPRAFSDFLRAEYRRDADAVDAWGTPYYLRAERLQTVVGSAGRDREPGTADDILTPVPARPH